MHQLPPLGPRRRHDLHRRLERRLLRFRQGVFVVKVIDHLLDPHRILRRQVALVEHAADVGIAGRVDIDREGGHRLLRHHLHAVDLHVLVVLAINVARLRLDVIATGDRGRRRRHHLRRGKSDRRRSGRRSAGGGDGGRSVTGDVRSTRPALRSWVVFRVAGSVTDDIVFVGRNLRAATVRWLRLARRKGEGGYGGELDLGKTSHAEVPMFDSLTPARWRGEWGQFTSNYSRNLVHSSGGGGGRCPSTHAFMSASSTGSGRGPGPSRAA